MRLNCKKKTERNTYSLRENLKIHFIHHYLASEGRDFIIKFKVKFNE